MMVAAPANAQITSINDLLSQVRQDAAETERENREREQKFINNEREQASLLAEAKRELAGLERQAQTVQSSFAGNERRVDALEAELKSAQGEFGEVFGLARAKAGEFKATLDSSIVSAQYPDRTAVLGTIAESNALPSTDQLNAIWQLMVQEMQAQSQVATFTTDVANLGADISVTRIGPFNAFRADNGEFLSYVAPSGDQGAGLVVLPKAVTGTAASAASNVIAAGSGALVNAPIDPTRGSLIASFERVPTLYERFEQGKAIAKIIAALLIIGAIFGILKIVMLVLTSAAVKGQKKKTQGSKSNPLGRIMMAAEGAREGDGEAMELKLDEAILKEVPKLEFGLNFLKLAAGIAPLLGLLGTVTGMIQTFQAMMIYGTGDPQLMAGGISEALVTTAAGLIAAIPLLILHSFCASLARGVQGTLEEQSAGIVARHIESRHA